MPSASSAPTTPMMPHIAQGYPGRCREPRGRASTLSRSSSTIRWTTASSSASTMSRTTGSVPEARTHDAPAVARDGAGRRRRPPRPPRPRRGPSRRPPRRTRARWGTRVRSPSASAASGPCVATSWATRSAGEHAVARRRAVGEDHVAGLLAAERPAAPRRAPRSTCRSPTGTSWTSIPASRMAWWKPEVRHDRHDDAAAERRRRAGVAWRTARAASRRRARDRDPSTATQRSASPSSASAEVRAGGHDRVGERLGARSSRRCR